MFDRKLFAGLLALTILLPATVHAQRVEFPEFPRVPMPPSDLGAIMDLQMTGASSRSISMTVENGVKKINATEDALKAYIEEQPSGAILIKVTREYTSDDLDELMNEQPELYMHLKSIPEKTQDAEVAVSVWLTKTYEADNAEALEKEHPDVFKVYERFTSGTDADFGQFRFEGFRTPRALELNIDPGSIRIHPDTGGANSASESNSSSDSQTDSDYDEDSQSSSDFDIDR
jgi:hypothetical protein